jgi:hypothetical protein
VELALDPKKGRIKHLPHTAVFPRSHATLVQSCMHRNFQTNLAMYV